MKHSVRDTLACLLLLAVVSVGGARAQHRDAGKTIEGWAVDSTSAQGIAFATVQASGEGAKVVGGAICDSAGFFRIENVPAKATVVTIQALGYTPRTLRLDWATARDGVYALDSVRLAVSEVAIAQVAVQGEAPFLMLKPNKKVITPQAEDLASGAPLTDLLKRLPDFEVNGPMEIKLRGASFQVLINGKPSGLSPAQLNTINMTEVQSIEVITTPSVRYRASDVGGVVNIVTRRFRPGVNAVLQAAGGSDNCYSLSGSANVGFKKVNLFAALYGCYDGAKSAYTYQSEDAAGIFHERYEQRERMNDFRVQPKVGFDYTPTSRDVLSVFWNMRYIKGKYAQDATRAYLHEAEQQGGSVLRASQMENEVNAMYLHAFNDDGLELSISALGGHIALSEQTDRYGLQLGNREWRAEGVTPNDYFVSATVDLACPLPRDMQLDVGLAADVSGNDVQGSHAERASEAEEWRTIAGTVLHSNSLTQVYGAYVDFSCDLGDKVSLNAGARYEHYRMKCADEVRSEFSFSQQTNDFFFSGGVSYVPIKALHFSLSYSGRVDRPAPFQLAPAMSVTDFYNQYFVGNPNLVPAYSHGVELSSMQRKGSFSLHEDVKWTYCANAFASHTARLTDSTWLKNTVNLKQERSMYVGIGGNWDAASWCSIWGNASGQGVKSQSQEGEWLVYDAWSFRVRAGVDFPLGDMWILSAWGGYSSSQRGAYRHYKAKPDLSVSVYFYPLRTGQLILALRGINLLSTGMSYSTYTEEITSHWDLDWANRAVYLSVYWRLGDSYRSKIGERFNSGMNSVGR